MNASFQRRAPSDTGRRSKQVALVLLGTMGVVGGAVAWDAWKRASDDDVAAMPLEAPTPVAADQAYQNNDFIPGVGYYHATYHRWYPHPYNYYDPTRGYFAGGLWQTVPFALGLMSSRPSQDAVTAALAAQQARIDQLRRENQQARSSGGSHFFSNFRRSTSGGSSYSARPSGSPAPSAPKPSIQRGGFGSSGHSSGGHSSGGSSGS